MRSLTARENQMLERIVRRIDRKVAFQAVRRDDGDIELRLSVGRLNTTTQFGTTILEAAETDAMQFESLRGKIKRVCDRMRMPPPPLRAPKVEVQKDAGWGLRPGQRGGRR